MTKDEAQELVMKNGFLLKDLPDEFKKDELIVLQAIQMGDKQQTSLGDEYYFNGEYELPFCYADDSLKNNREFVLKAVGLNGSSIQYAKEGFKKDKEIILKAVSSPQISFAFTFADISLQNDRDIVEAAVKNDGSV